MSIGTAGGFFYCAKYEDERSNPGSTLNFSPYIESTKEQEATARGRAIIESFARIIYRVLQDDQPSKNSDLTDAFAKIESLLQSRTLPATSVVLLESVFEEFSGKPLRQMLPQELNDVHAALFQSAVDLICAKSRQINLQEF